MTWARAAACVVLAALVLAAPARGKEFASLVVVGADGRSLQLRPPPAVLDSLFSARAGARPEGSYLRLYPLDPTGHVGIPGRFYPGTGAVCLSWNQAAAPRGCRRLEGQLRAELGRAQAFRRFRGAGTTLAELAGLLVPRNVASQLRVAVELAFDRSLLARPAPPLRRCFRFLARWRGSAAKSRPRDFCLSPRRVYAGGILHPLGVAPWRLAWDNRLEWCTPCGPLRRIARAGVSALYPRSWHVQTVERIVVNPKLRFQLSTEAGEEGASVSARGAVIRVQELVPPLLTQRGLWDFPLRPRRFDLRTFSRLESWPRGRGTRFRERGRAIYVWVALGREASAATRGRVLAVVDSLRVGPKP